MPEITKETINRALLGDPEAAKECTENDIILQCPVCCADDIGIANEYGSYCIHCPYCGEATQWYDTPYKALLHWNSRPDLRTAAKELYAPKWIACNEKLPEANGKYLTRCLPIGGKDEYGYGILDFDYGVWHATWLEFKEGAITHWMPLLELPGGAK
ncbi:hypothetical protein AGMMS49992_29840 [Clostridia bacterium]|nr:hypothetical protein AGMMS49992_29840 [Clostridia bacterium]